MKIKIKDMKTLKDSIEETKKKIMDVEIDLTKPGIESIANALIERKEEINQTASYPELRDIMKEVLEKFDTPKAKEIKLELEKYDRMFNRDPRKGSHNDYWLWDKLLKYCYNILLKASGNPSPDTKYVEKELGHLMKNSNKETEDSCKDEEPDERLELARLLGVAHDKIIEALDLAESLENEDKISSDLRYAIEDIEAPLSELDFMGESKPVEVMMGTYPVEESESWEIDEEDW